MRYCPKILQIVVSMLLFWDMKVVLGQEYVWVNGGALEGITLITRKDRSISAFLGIPYAKPPVGPLRFKSPVVVEQWKDTYVADTDGKQCPQLGDDGETVIGLARSASNFGPGYLLDKDIILVTLHYRLGALGFLSTSDSYAPGNYGLKEQVFALKWVKENIENFGGDRNRVTLFGQDAGGASASLHSVSDASNGLFHRFISQSGTALCPWAFIDTIQFKDRYTKNAKKLGEKLGCPLENSQILIDCLRGKDTRTLVGASNIFDDFNFLKNWGPTDEPNLKGAFLTKRPLAKNAGRKPSRSMIGHVTDEGLLYTAELYSNDEAYKKLVDNFDAFLTYVTLTYLGDTKNSDTYVQYVKAKFFENISPSEKEKFLQNVTNLLSDTSFLSPADEFTEGMLSGKNIIYYYSFNYRGIFSKTSRTIDGSGNNGVNHGDDLNYLFPANQDQFNESQLGLTESDEEMIDTMVELWTSFAATGIPSTERFSDPNFWPLYTYENKEYLKIGDDADTTLDRKDNFQQDRMEFWIGLVGRLLYDFYLQVANSDNRA